MNRIHENSLLSQERYFTWWNLNMTLLKLQQLRTHSTKIQNCQLLKAVLMLIVVLDQEKNHPLPFQSELSIWTGQHKSKKLMFLHSRFARKQSPKTLFVFSPNMLLSIGGRTTMQSFWTQQHFKTHKGKMKIIPVKFLQIMTNSLILKSTQCFATEKSR